MILLIGDNNPVRIAFHDELCRRGIRFASMGFHEANLADLHVAYELVRKLRPNLVIVANSAVGGGLQGSREKNREQLLQEGVLIPQTISQVCRMRNVTWAKVSNGSVFRGLKVFSRGRWKVEIDGTRAEVRRLVRASSALISGYTEMDEPNHCFVCPPCDFCSGVAAMGEQATHGVGNGYIWRHGVLLVESNGGGSGAAEEQPSAGFASGSVMKDFVRGCLHLWDIGAAPGIYNVVNPGVVDMSRRDALNGLRVLDPAPAPSYLLDDTKIRLCCVTLPPLGSIRVGSSAPFSDGGDPRPFEAARQTANAV